MNIASLDLCKELYKVSGWDDTNDKTLDRNNMVIAVHYDLGYLLRKMPMMIRDAAIEITHGDVGWVCGYVHSHAEIRDGKSLWIQRVDYVAVSVSPENVLCKLAIELFKQGVLTKEPKQ